MIPKEQNSDSWRKWRDKGIGASDAPIILGVSPFKTPFQLWEEKVGLKKSVSGENFATQKGHDFENIAREHYQFKVGFAVEPCNVEHPKFKFIRASLDGARFDKKVITEIKNPGREAHAEAIAGRVPTYYIPQVQHQLACVPEAEECHYWSFCDNHGALVVVKRDEELIQKILEAELEFWNCVKSKRPVELSDKDWKVIDSQPAKDLVQLFRIHKEKIEELEAKQKEIKAQLLEYGEGHKRIICDGLSIGEIARAGAVDYKKIPELQGVDLDAYRKKPTSYVMARERKKS